jgi:hypothetical protein
MRPRDSLASTASWAIGLNPRIKQLGSRRRPWYELGAALSFVFCLVAQFRFSALRYGALEAVIRNLAPKKKDQEIKATLTSLKRFKSKDFPELEVVAGHVWQGLASCQKLRTTVSELKKVSGSLFKKGWFETAQWRETLSGPGLM